MRVEPKTGPIKSLLVLNKKVIGKSSVTAPDSGYSTSFRKVRGALGKIACPWERRFKAMKCIFFVDCKGIVDEMKGARCALA